MAIASGNRVRKSDIARVRRILEIESRTYREADATDRRTMLGYAVEMTVEHEVFSIDDVLADFEANW